MKQKLSSILFSFALTSCVALHAQVTRYEPQPVDGPKATGGASGPSWLMPLQTLDKQLPPWISLGGDYRSRLEGAEGRNFSRSSDSYLLSQFRLWLTLKPTSWLSAVVETQDSRIFFNQVVQPVIPYQNTWDLRQAYVQLGNARESWWDVTAGRQILSFGEERLIGPSDWLNMGRTFDAVRVDLHQPWWMVSVFTSAVIVARDGVIDHHLQGNNFHGIYGSLKHLVPRATVEPYVLWRLAPATVRLSENAGLGALNEVTAGVHWKGKLPAGFEYSTEMVKQAGSLGPYSIHSWAGHWLAGKTFQSPPLQPRIFIESNYASGTKNLLTRGWGTFDQLYPSSHDKLGFADQVGWRNIVQVRTGIEEKIATKWTLRQTYENFWLASTEDGLYGANGSLAVKAPAKPAGRHVGQEMDFDFAYQYNRAVIAGCGYARLFTGEFLNNATPGRDFQYPYGYLTFRF